MPNLQTLLLGIVALMVVVLLVLIFRWLRDPVFSPLQKIYLFGAWALARGLWGTQWIGKLHVPETGPCVIICNHRSSVDPFFIQPNCPRKIRWMVAREYCSHPLFSWFLKPCEVISVGRGGIDTTATKEAFRVVDSGGVVGMLPEGRINMTGELLLPVRPGAALVALRKGVPVIPCYIEGAPYNRVPWSPFLMMARVKVHCGPPVELSDLYGREFDEGVQAEAILRCAKALAVLAGQPDFEPKLAGRKWKPGTEDVEDAVPSAE